MAWIVKWVERFRRFDAVVFSIDPRIHLPDFAKAILARDNLVIADVGAAGGVDSRWSALRGLVRFLTFEPRPTGLDPSATNNFPICLGAHKEQRTLYLTKFADSSSLFPINWDRMAEFAGHDCFSPAGSSLIEVDTLDSCLKRQSDLNPYFLKLDVEGAELDVLRGAQATLECSVMGIRVELSFLPRHVGAPLFGEVDAFLRQRGFELFALSRELMIRSNLVHGPLCQPQLGWGDGLYFLTRQSFLSRLSTLAAEQRVTALTKFVAILLSHRVCDYAVEVIEAARVSEFVSTDYAAELRRTAHQCAGASLCWMLKAGVAACVALLIFALALPFGEARKWATLYLKRRLGVLLNYFWRLTARGGEDNSRISDQQM